MNVMTKKRGKTVCMVTPRGWPESYGGAEEQCYKQAELLFALGYQVMILTSRIDPHVPETDRRGNISYHRILTRDFPDKGGWNVIFAFVWIFRAIMYLSKQNFDLIHSHQGKIHALVGCYLNKTRGLPHFVKIGNSGIGFDLFRLSKRALYGRFVARFVVRYTSVFIAISKNIQEELLQFGVPPERIRYIPNCVSVSLNSITERSASRESKLQSIGIDPRATVFAIVGRLEPQKLVSLSIQAFLRAVSGSKLVDSRVCLCVVGDGVLEDELKKQVCESGFAEAVHFMGRRQDVPQLMFAFDGLLLVSKSEGLSNALLEAMSAGCVPIASKLSGNVDLIESGKNGFLVDNSVEAIAEMITIMARTNQKQRESMSQQAHQKVFETCAPSVVGRELGECVEHYTY